MNSEWVRREIKRARATERVEQRQKLFPIRLASIDRIRDWRCDDADTGKDLAVELREDHIPDFSNWKNHDAFESAESLCILIRSSLSDFAIRRPTHGS